MIDNESKPVIFKDEALECEVRRFIRCGNGHYYYGEKYNACPYCGIGIPLGCESEMPGLVDSIFGLGG